jgi:hypothetical protein
VNSPVVRQNEFSGSNIYDPLIESLRQKPLLQHSVPPEQWPLWAVTISKFRQPGDVGLGDTIERLAARMGGNQFKAWFKKLTGQDCGCSRRREQFNTLYPYSP